jgi:intracellular septation protein A
VNATIAKEAPVQASERAGVMPRVQDVIVRTAISLATAVLAPAILFALTFSALGISAAVLVALAWMIAATCWRKARGHPVSALLILTLGIMTIRSTFTLATGNTFVYFIQPVFSDACVAGIFLGSLLTQRPLIARLAPDFYPMNRSMAARPGIQRLLRQLTLMWGLVIVVKGSLTLWLLTSLSTVNFVLVKGAAIFTLTLLAAAATITIASIVVRRERRAMSAHAQRIGVITA